MKVGVWVQGTEEQGDREGGGGEAAKDKEKGRGGEAAKDKEKGRGGDENIESGATGIDYDPLDTVAVHKDRGEEREGGPATKK